MIVSDFTLSDPKGVFLRSPELRIDWRPIRYLADHIDIKSATAKTLVMEKIPAFKAVPDTGEPLLPDLDIDVGRSEEHTSELPSLMRISYAVCCLKNNNSQTTSLIT